MGTSINNTQQGYGWLAIVLHWLTALGIFFLFGLGLYMVELTYYDAWYKGSLDLHKSIGIVLLMLWLGRIAWRLRSISPAAIGELWEKKLAAWMHLALYATPLLLMLSGYLISTADGRAIVVFELFSVPALPISVDNQEDIAGQAHWVLAWFLIGMASLHAVAALKHQYINKDGTLARMLKSQG